MSKCFVIFLGGFLAFTSFSVFQSCNECSDGPIFFSWNAVTMQAKKLTGIELLGNFSAPYYTSEAYIPSDKGIRYDSIGFHLSWELLALSTHSTGSFVSRAFACSPAEKYENLFSIAVTSSEDYSSAFPAGADLAPILVIRKGYSVLGTSIPLFLSTNQITSEPLLLTFAIPPQQLAQHTLVFTYRFENEKVLTTELADIFLRP